MSESQLLAKQENEDYNKANQEAIVLQTIKEMENVSSIELAKGTNLPLSTISARLRGLEENGLIKKSGRKLVESRWYSTYTAIESHESQIDAQQQFKRARKLKAAKKFIKEFRLILSKDTLDSLIFEVENYKAA